MMGFFEWLGISGKPRDAPETVSDAPAWRMWKRTHPARRRLGRHSEMWYALEYTRYPCRSRSQRNG